MPRLPGKFRVTIENLETGCREQYTLCSLPVRYFLVKKFGKNFDDIQYATISEFMDFLRKKLVEWNKISP